MPHTKKIFIALSFFAITACDPGQPGGSSGFSVSGFARPLSQAEFNQLPADQQYMVANKLTGTFFKGVSAEDFFDLSNGTGTLVPSSTTFLNDTKAAMRVELNANEIYVFDAEIDGLDSEGNPDPANAKYLFDTNGDANNNQRPRQLPLARMKEYPISKNQFVHWMAYFLANTIMFSPAEEMESTDMNDVQSMYRFLVESLENDESIRQIVRSNLPSLARWRVSRSPENHALEAYELYLGLFETEEDSLRGGIACKDLYLTSEDDDYLIRRTDFPNTVPQLVLGTNYITTCDDLYALIAGHPLLIPRVTEVILNYLMSGRSLEDRLSMIGSITASNPETFEDIFTAILFSREYLLNTERPKSYEENLMPLLDNLKWDPRSGGAGELDERIFIRMTSTNVNDRIGLPAKGWASMSYKIGRLPDVPLDGISFASYHKAIREEFLTRGVSSPTSNYNSTAYQGGIGTEGLFYDANGDVRAVIASMSPNDFVDFLFLNALQRKATDVEKTDLMNIVRNDLNNGAAQNHLQIVDGVEEIRAGRYDDIARIVYDYISRLSEFYYFKAVN